MFSSSSSSSISLSACGCLSCDVRDFLVLDDGGFVLTLFEAFLLEWLVVVANTNGLDVETGHPSGRESGGDFSSFFFCVRLFVDTVVLLLRLLFVCRLVAFFFVMAAVGDFIGVLLLFMCDYAYIHLRECIYLVASMSSIVSSLFTIWIRVDTYLCT